MALAKPGHKTPDGDAPSGPIARVRLRRCMSNEREQLSRAFDQSRSRLAYLNLALTGILVIAAVIRIWLIAFGY